MNARTDAAPVNWNALKKFSKVFVTILLSLTLGLAAGEPVLASSYNTVYSNTFTLTFKVDNATTYNINTFDDAVDVTIPLYLAISTTSTISNFSYLNGIANVNGSILSQLTCYINGAVADFNYFEPVTDDGIIMDRIDTYSYLIFNNFVFVNQTASYSNYLVGYIHYSRPVGGTPVTVSFNNATYQVQPGSAYPIYVSEAPYGFVHGIAAAINECSDINTIINWLSNISQNTDYLPYILQDLEDNFETVIDWLSDISHSNYDLYVLIRDYLEDQELGQPVSEAANVANSMAAAQVAEEAALMSMAPGNMEELDAADALGILDDVSNSTRFWGTLVQEFSTASGAIWGVFIFALLVGLITFILRLR